MGSGPCGVSCAMLIREETVLLLLFLLLVVTVALLGGDSVGVVTIIIAATQFVTLALMSGSGNGGTASVRVAIM